MEQFDALIEEAAELPRMYGYAPKTDALYSSVELRKAARTKQFKEMDTDKTGYITLNEWIKFAINHFIKRAVNTKSPEYKELYAFLMRTFQAGDKEGYGEVGPAEFDEMIECAANAPRRFGLAPKSSEMFKNDAERLAKRMQHLSMMDTHCTGKISFDEWLKFAMEHIVSKVKGL